MKGMLNLMVNDIDNYLDSLLMKHKSAYSSLYSSEELFIAFGWSHFNLNTINKQSSDIQLTKLIFRTIE